MLLKNKKAQSLGSFCQMFSYDYFCIKPSELLTFDKRSNYSSYDGKIATLLFLILSILVTENFSENMLYRKNPQSILSQIVTPDPEYINLQESGYFMAFGLQDLRNKSIHYIDPSIYTVKMTQRTKIGTNITLEELPLRKCSIEMVPERDNLRDYFLRNQINNLYCFDGSSDLSPALQSTWDGPLYKNLLIDIYPCVNATSNNQICKTTDEIKKYLNAGNFAMYFTNMAIDPNNFETPIMSFGNQMYTPISDSTLSYIEMRFGHSEFMSDNGLIAEEWDDRKLANYVSTRQVLSFSSNQVVQIDMKLDKVKTIYSRSYDKIQTILGNVGGILQIFSLVANLMVLPLVKHRLRVNLSNSIFNFKIPRKNNNKNKISTSKNQKVQKKSSNMMMINNFVTSSMGESKKKILSYFNSETKKLNLGFFQYHLGGCLDWYSRSSKKLFNKSLHQIDHMLDISFLMNKMKEIDVIKMLLLSPTQKNLLEYIPKSEISLEAAVKTKSHKILNTLYLRSNSEKAEMAYKAYFSISGKAEKDSIDQKLLDMVPKLKKMHTRNPEVDGTSKSIV